MKIPSSCLRWLVCHSNRLQAIEHATDLPPLTTALFRVWWKITFFNVFLEDLQTWPPSAANFSPFRYGRQWKLFGMTHIFRWLACHSNRLQAIERARDLPHLLRYRVLQRFLESDGKLLSLIYFWKTHKLDHLWQLISYPSVGCPKMFKLVN